MKSKTHIIWLICLLPGIALADWEAKVTEVLDGDTFMVTRGGSNSKKIKLYGIDCPEISQAYGKEAKEFTTKLIEGKTVNIKFKTFGRSQKLISIVYVDSKCLNEELLRAGLAWHHLRYGIITDWNALCEQARHHRIGLWAAETATPPWLYKKNIKACLRYDKDMKKWIDCEATNTRRNDRVITLGPYKDDPRYPGDYNRSSGFSCPYQ